MSCSPPCFPPMDPPPSAYVHVYICRCMCIYIYVYIFNCIYFYFCSCMYACRYLIMRVYTCVCTHSHPVHELTFTPTHAHMFKSFKSPKNSTTGFSFVDQGVHEARAIDSTRAYTVQVCCDLLQCVAVCCTKLALYILGEHVLCGWNRHFRTHAFIHKNTHTHTHIHTHTHTHTHAHTYTHTHTTYTHTRTHVWIKVQKARTIFSRRARALPCET